VPPSRKTRIAARPSRRKATRTASRARAGVRNGFERLPVPRSSPRGATQKVIRSGTRVPAGAGLTIDNTHAAVTSSPESRPATVLARGLTVDTPTGYRRPALAPRLPQARTLRCRRARARSHSGTVSTKATDRAHTPADLDPHLGQSTSPGGSVSPSGSSSRARPTSEVNGTGMLCSTECAGKRGRDERVAIDADHHTTQTLRSCDSSPSGVLAATAPDRGVRDPLTASATGVPRTGVVSVSRGAPRALSRSRLAPGSRRR
jgi:hypothetical protein